MDGSLVTRVMIAGRVENSTEPAALLGSLTRHRSISQGSGNFVRSFALCTIGLARAGSASDRAGALEEARFAPTEAQLTGHHAVVVLIDCLEKQRRSSG